MPHREKQNMSGTQNISGGRVRFSENLYTRLRARCALPLNGNPNAFSYLFRPFADF
jgi:hypothetical protein